MIAVRSLDIITIAVPPALPIALTIGYMMARSRLAKKNVYCTSPSAINIAGCIDLVCMDKTGTMTEGGLDFEKLLPTNDGHFVSQTSPELLPHESPLLRCLVTCHSLALVDGKAIGDPMEEKMFQMANWTILENSQVEQMEPHPLCVVSSGKGGETPMGIIRQLPFSSHHQRMSVVACPINDVTDRHLYLKGAPETVVKICRISTVPADLNLHLSGLTELGYRVLGLATKSLKRNDIDDVMSMDRSELEKDMDFLGLLVFENKLKPETCPVIKQLKKAQMRLVMLTGDNPLTAVSVARQAGIIDDSDQVISLTAEAPSEDSAIAPQLDYVEIKQSVPTVKINTTKHQKDIERMPSNIAGILPIAPAQPVKLVVTGSTWQVVKQYFPEEIDKILLRGAVFARVNPNQKKEIIEGLQNLGYYALMCGDGANDCGALRAACTGISLSQAEASVASPFTSRVENISCIHLLLREGRCALVTSFSIFRFMLLYALIQFISCFLLYSIAANLGQYGFLYADLFITTTLVFTMSFTEAYDHLVSEKPPMSLLETRMILSLILQAILIISFQVLAFLYCIHGGHPWFLPYRPSSTEESFISFEYYSVFIVCIFQYTIMAIVLSKGVPFRKPLFTNWLFVLNLCINFAANIFLCFDPTPRFPEHPANLVNAEYHSFAELLELAMPPSVEYRGIIFLFAAVFFFASLLAESIFIDRQWAVRKIEKLIDKIMKRTKPKQHKYEILEEQLGTIGAMWPPVKTSSQATTSMFTLQVPISRFHHSGPDTSTQNLLISSSSSIESYGYDNPMMLGTTV